MKLITEEVSQVKFITEGKGKGKKLYIEGVFLQGGIKNRNGECILLIFWKMKLTDTIKLCISRRALGELGHPEGPQLT